MTKRAVIYARVSTDEQAEHGYSRESQVEACRTYAAGNGLTVVAELREDYSGAKLDRPELDRLREMIRRREIEAVIVFSPDRLTRNLAHSLILREELQRAGIELHYCNRGKSENTPESRMTENIEAVFGDYWREKIIESSRRGRLSKAANGKWPCDGHAAYGYRKEGKGRDARLVVHEAEEGHCALHSETASICLR
ncbi:MAG: recombinase family protein [Chloroflexi bacterium]|nr:recombinase family protein [Chloroflexota bacterium]